MPKMNGKKLPYPDADKRMGGGKIMYRGGGSLSYGKMKMGGGGVAEDTGAAQANFQGMTSEQQARTLMGGMGRGMGMNFQMEGSTRGPNPSELDGREREEQEEYLRRLEKANKASKSKEKKGMGGSIARGSGAARAQQFRRNG